MRKGSAEIGWSLRMAMVALAFAAALSGVQAQGGGGRSDSVRIPSPSEEIDRRRSRTTYQNRRPASRVPLPATGRVTLRVSEGSSRLQIFQLGSDVPVETIEIPERSTSLIIRTLDVGRYVIKARKPGFHDEVRAVEIEKDQGRRISIDLRPEMAILSISSNVPDARFFIDKLGEFERPVQKALVKPQSYQIKVSRRGYVSRTLTVDLKLPGSEENLNVILEPLRVDAVLDLAFEHIDEGQLGEAEALARDVLELNPQHARANLVLGMAALHRPDVDRAVEWILRAVSNGETFSLPVLVLADPADTNTVAATLRLDLRSLRFESSERPGLNFAINGDGLGRFESDGNAINLTGRSDFYGRAIEPRLLVYSPLSSVGCGVPTTSRTCASDLQLLSTLIAQWRKQVVLERPNADGLRSNSL